MKERITVIPKPVSVKYTEGAYQSEGLSLISGDTSFTGEIEIANNQLRCALEKLGFKGPLREPGNIFCLKKGDDEESEAYSIVISKEKITIEAASSKGIYHGLQTLRQLVLSVFNNGALVLPCAEIQDYPCFSWRGLMLDCSRYFYTVPFIKELIDTLSLHHINRFHWHLTDDQGWRLPVAEYPLLTEIGSLRKDSRMRWKPPQGGFYSEDEIRDVVDYAAKRHIETIPEVDLPGHASAILASYPELGCTGGPYQVEERFGIFEDVLCAGNDRILDLAAKIFDVLVKLFPSKWVHIGGDEVRYNRWEACPKCRKRLAELGLKKPDELQSWITSLLVKMLSERGRTAIGWDEILEDSEKFKLPKDTIVMSWRGEAGGVRASALGHQVIMTPNSCGCYLDYKHINTAEEPGQSYEPGASVYKAYSMQPVTPEMKSGSEKLILGGQGNLWAELIYAGKFAQYMIFPRICAIAETVWTPKEGKDFEDFSSRLEVHRRRLDTLGIYQYRGPLK